jgi:peroxiredoxin
MSDRNFPFPKSQAPELSFNLTNGDQWSLNDQHPESFTMIVFYRGLHCPVCKEYTHTLDGMLDEFSERGVHAVTVSMDDEERARTSVQKWGIEDLDVGYGLTEKQAREWGLYLSEGINEKEPELFSEPGLFLVKPNGKLYYSAVNSMPFGRPDFEEVLQGIDFVKKQDYPARGEIN